MTESQICTLFAAHAEKIQLLEYQLHQKDEEIRILEEANRNLIDQIEHLHVEIHIAKGDGK